MELKRVHGLQGTVDIAGLLEHVERVDGRPGLSERKARDLEGPFRGIGVAGVEDGAVVAYAHAMELTGTDAWEVEAIVGPDTRSPGRYAEITGGLLAELPGGAPAHVWASHPHHQQVMEAAGHACFRELRQLRRPLPAPTAQLPEGTRLATFRPGVDDEHWLATYRAAFSAHPDGPGWDLGELRARMELPWFDPDGFLLTWEGDDLAGFCWTKVHGGGVGEIYIVGVHPDHGGRGLGRTLVLAGLEHLHRDQGCHIGMLYVDAANRAAVRLYEGLGFHEAWVSLCFEVGAQPKR